MTEHYSPHETMNFNFEGKKVLVTGAGRGIGRGIASTLANSGCKVYAVDINEQLLETLSKEFSNIVPISLDITKWDETKSVLKDVEALDGVVNNAGTAFRRPALETTKEDLDTIMAINLFAAINVTQVCAKKMIEQKKPGSIVNISSVTGMGSVHAFLAYSVSKAGLDMVTKQFALELGAHNIRVNSVQPNLVNTDLAKKVIAEGIPLDKLVKERNVIPRPLEVNEVVGPVMYLLSNHSAMVTGTQHAVDGGLLCNLSTN